jgi:uncharacterized protein YdaU (DUF1376 family)
MHFYSWNIGDFNLHTSHLTLEEEGVYRRLLDFYYDTELPIPIKTQPVIRRLRLLSYEPIVASILEEFFFKQADGWHNLRADIEIDDYHAKARTARVNGKKGGRPKKNGAPKTQSVILNNPEETQPVILANPDLTQTKAKQELITNNEELITNNYVNPFPRLKSLNGIDFSLWPNLPGDKTMASWLKCRAKKKLVNSQEAMDLTLREVIKASEFGASANDCIWMAAARGWGGFKADWIKKDIASDNPSYQGNLLKSKIGSIMDRSWAE